MKENIGAKVLDLGINEVRLKKKMGCDWGNEGKKKKMGFIPRVSQLIIQQP